MLASLGNLPMPAANTKLVAALSQWLTGQRATLK
jgi:hypothetical protein